MSLTRLLVPLLCSWTAVAATAPVLTYSTYLRDSFTPNAIAVDSSGNIYLAGSAVIDPASSTKAAMVAKLNPQASQYIYVSFLNGQTNQVVNAIAVDTAGDAYAAGSYGVSGAPPQAFVAKLDPSGDMVFSVTLGGSLSSAAQAVAVTATGQILVSGTSYAAGFPSTPGAYSITNTKDQPWLLELDATASQTVFSATGIGGSSIALDPTGNIYVSGSTSQLNYPTTPGVYQPTFPAFSVCGSFVPSCMPVQGENQYITKVNPTGSALIYSTALTGSGVSTTNTGLAVDANGNAYVTGLAGAAYPFTVTPPAIPPASSGLPFLSKLDPLGQQLLFSVPVGGAGLQVDSYGVVYVGGSISSVAGGLAAITASLPALAGVPSQCLPNSLTIEDSSYVSNLDGSTGSLIGTQFLGGSTLTLSAVALSGSTLWIAGATNDPNVPFTPNALTLQNFPPGLRTGAYLGAVDFSQPQPPAGTPQIACVIDPGDYAPMGPAAQYQLLTLFGTGLGPAAGIAAMNSTTTTLGGVTVDFGSTPAPLLYASSTQVNLAVPPLAAQQFSPLQLSVGGVAASARALPLATAVNPSLFLNVEQSLPVTSNSPGFVAEALNADGSLNSPGNPADLGSVISVFVNGLTPNPDITSAPVQFFADGWTVTNVQPATSFVLEVSLRTPAALTTGLQGFSCPPDQTPVCTVNLSLFYGYGGVPLGAVGVGQAHSAVVFVSQPDNTLSVRRIHK